MTDVSEPVSKDTDSQKVVRTVYETVEIPRHGAREMIDAMRAAERWVTRLDERQRLRNAADVLDLLMAAPPPELDDLVAVPRQDLDTVLRELCGSPAAWRAALRLVDEVRL
jgi:hypothetical protein